MKFNRDYRTRDAIISAYADPGASFGGTTRFKGLPIKKLQMLIDKGFADPSSRQNNSPTIGRIAAFMRQYPAVTAEGYSVTIERDDYRVSVDGIDVAKDKVTPELKEAFKKFGMTADEYSDKGEYGRLGYLRAWWD